MDIRVDTGVKDVPIQIFHGIGYFYADTNEKLRVASPSPDGEICHAIFNEWIMVRQLNDGEIKQYETTSR